MYLYSRRGIREQLFPFYKFIGSQISLKSLFFRDNKRKEEPLKEREGERAIKNNLEFRTQFLTIKWVWLSKRSTGTVIWRADHSAARLIHCDKERRRKTQVSDGDELRHRRESGQPTGPVIYLNVFMNIQTHRPQHASPANSPAALNVYKYWVYSSILKYYSF